MLKVGDTIYTIKRGKGKIIADRESMPRRFKVAFEADKDHSTIICRHPKTTNLIPTEAKYEAAERQAEKIAKIKAAEEALYQAAKNMAAAFGQTTDQIKFPSGGVVSDAPRMIFAGEPFIVPPKSPSIALLEKQLAENNKKLQEIMDEVKKKKDELKKMSAPSVKFKVGDAVYFEGKKCEIRGMSNDNVNQLIKSGLDYCLRPESDLRLWVDTKITHDDEMDVVRNDLWLKDLKSPKFIGIHINGKAIFSEDAGNGKMVIWYGIKGDDI